MKASLKTSDLVAALARMKGVVARKSVLPVLSGVLIEATEQGIELTGCNLDTYLTLYVPADVALEGLTDGKTVHVLMPMRMM